MIPNKHPHTGPPGRLVTWGSPWHGLVTDGVMALPNATTMPYTAGSEGDVIAFRPPGTVPPPRPPAWRAADAEAGREWRDYALITGRTQRRLYGQVIAPHGAWLYAAPTGSRWLMQIDELPAAAKDVTAPWALTITATRFGDIALGTAATGELGAVGTPTEQHTLNCTLSDWQQAIAGKAGGDYSLAGVGVVTTCAVWLEDASLSGARAVLMVGLDYPDDPIRRRPTGFLEIILTGTPGVDGVATITVARTRAKTLGTVTYVEDGALGVKYLDNDVNVVLVADGNPPDCNETMIRNNFPVALPMSDSGSWQVQFGTRTRTAALTDRILAATYDGEDLTDTTLSAINVATDAAGQPGFVGSGVQILENNGTSPGGADWCGTIASWSLVSDNALWQYTSNLTSVAQCTLTLARGNIGVKLDAREAVSVEEVQQASISHLIGWPTGPFTFSRTYGEHAETITGTSQNVHSPDQGQLIVVFSPLELAALSLGVGYGDGADGFFADQVVATNNANFAPQKLRHAVQRYSNRLLELVVNKVDEANEPTSWDYMGAVGGAEPGGQLLDQQAERPYGSAQPITGAVARPSAAPVVWA